MEHEGIPTTDYYPVQEVCKKLPGRRPGKPISARTLLRYRTHGVVRRGVRIRLRTTRLGGTDYFTCDAWVQAFLASVNADAEPAAHAAAAWRQKAADDAPKERSPWKQQRDGEAAKQRLEELWSSKQTA